MSKNIPSKNLDRLQKLIGSKIISVKRQIFKSDMDLEDFQENADGPIELQLDNKTVLHFKAFTEGNSVIIAEGNMSSYGDSYLKMDVSNSFFWQNKLRKEITKVYILRAEFSTKDYPLEFALEIEFENSDRVFIEYINDNGIIFDAIRSSDRCDESTALRIEVKKN